MNSATVIYLYGITSKSDDLVGVTGVDGVSAVTALECSGLFCWVSRVSRAEFADRLQNNMDNLDWLATATVQHQRVVSTVAQVSDVLPARFGTIFLNETSLEQDIHRRKRVLDADLHRIKNSDEWGVKVFRLATKPQMSTAAVRSGKEYLKAKASILQRRPEKGSDIDIQRFSSALKRIAVETAEVGKVSGGQRGLQWQTSLLLKRADRKRFETVLKKFSKEWANQRQIETTGPWPPYSFVSRDNSRSTA